MARSSRARRGLRKNIVWRRPRMNRSEDPMIGSGVFWAIVALCVAMNLWPEGRMVTAPFWYLKVWAHELAHLLAAKLTGGDIIQFILTPEFGGIATSHKSGNISGAVGAAAGLLGPSLAAGAMIILVRGMGQSAFALMLLALGLIGSGLFWSGDLFTKAITVSLGVIIILLAFIGQAWLRSIVALVVAVFFAVNGILALDYAFISAATVDGRSFPSDTAQVAAYVGGSHRFWGSLISATSILILFLSYSLSRSVRRRRR